MPKKTVVVPTQKILNSLKTVGSYARNPYGIAVIGSISLHVVAAVALPSWSESEENTETGTQEVVRVVDLPAEVQSRLPSLSPSIDLSVFENNPDFNIDMSAIGNGTIPGGNGLNGLTGLDGNSTVFLPGTGMLPTPFAPSSGRVNYSFVPNSPPAIASRYIAPPPPNFAGGLLPPPPGVPAFSGSGNIFNVPINPNNTNASIAPAPGNQQVFAINPQSRNTSSASGDLVQRQRQLENEAAIALSPSTFAPGNPDIRFNADLLQPSDLKNPAALLPRPQAQPPTTKTPQTVTRNSSAVSRSIRGNYPKSACSSQASGTATYNVVVTPSGAPSQWSLSSSSGNNSLDNQASQDIRNVSFDGASSNYRVSVGYTYQPSFCAAFIKPQPQTPAPATPKPPAAPAPQPTAPAPLVIEVPEVKPTPPPAPIIAPAPTPTAPTSPPKPTPVAPDPAPAPTPPPAAIAPPVEPAAPEPAPAPASTAEE